MVRRSGQLRSRGFTLFETLMALGVTVLIIGALSALALAVSSAWKAGESAEQLDISARQSAAQVSATLRSSRYAALGTADGQVVAAITTVGGARNISAQATAGAAVFIWREDTNGDQIMQTCELALLEHDIASQTLKLYQLPAAAAGAQTQFHSYDVADSGDAGAFKVLPGIQVQKVANFVAEAKFAVGAAGGSARQGVEFTLKFRVGGLERVEYGTATLRGSIVPKEPA